MLEEVLLELAAKSRRSSCPCRLRQRAMIWTMLLGPSGLGKPVWLLVFFEDALLLSIICILFRSEGKRQAKERKEDKES